MPERSDRSGKEREKEERCWADAQSVGFLPLVPLVTIKSVETVIKVLQHILMPRLGPHPSQPGTPDHISQHSDEENSEKTLSIAIKLCGV